MRKPKRKREKPVLRDGLFALYGNLIIIPVFFAIFAICIISGMISIIVGKFAIFFSGHSDEPLIDLALFFSTTISSMTGLSLMGVIVAIRHYTRSQFNNWLACGISLAIVALSNLVFFFLFF